MTQAIDKKIKDFRKDLLTSDEVTVLRKHILFGERHHLSNDDYFELRKRVSTKWGIHPNDVILVGSAQTGFSISEKTITKIDGKIEVKKRYRKFSEASDVDIVIVSRDLFDSIWQRIYRYSLEVPYWLERASFQQYFFKGWIRPDKLPLMSKDCIRTEWFQFYNDLTSSKDFGENQICGAVYANWAFLEDYQLKAVKKCKENEK